MKYSQETMYPWIHVTHAFSWKKIRKGTKCCTHAHMHQPNISRTPIPKLNLMHCTVIHVKCQNKTYNNYMLEGKRN